MFKGNHSSFYRGERFITVSNPKLEGGFLDVVDLDFGFLQMLFLNDWIGDADPVERNGYEDV